MNNRIAVFAGTFDPVTMGHVDVVRRAAPLFDEIIIAIGVNTAKKTLFSLEKRTEWLERTFSDLSNIRIEHYEGLTVNFCESVGAKYLLRGLRNGTDFDYEAHIAQLNKSRGQLEVNGHALGMGDALLLADEPELHLANGQDAEVLVFDLAP